MEPFIQFMIRNDKMRSKYFHGICIPDKYDYYLESLIWPGYQASPLHNAYKNLF
jgi:hypothetical protein